jgi:hypothetical protein
LKKIAVTKGSGDNSNVITLGQVVPKIKRLSFDCPIWLTGGLVEHGVAVNDIDLVSHQELPPELQDQIRGVLGPSLADRLDFIVDPTGPAGPSLELRSDMSAEALAAWKYAGRFVLQEHGWGRKKHWDLRFGAPKTKRMWGWTCFSEPPQAAGARKVRCQEKKYHDPKWMTVDKKDIQPGQPGHPGRDTYKGPAYMLIVDKGKYDYIRRKPGFLEVVLHGDKWNGRYLFREIEVKPSKKAMAFYRVTGDEVAPKSDKIWIMWKPKDQTLSGPVKKMAYMLSEGNLLFWESDDDDTDLARLADLPIDSTDVYDPMDG